MKKIIFILVALVIVAGLGLWQIDSGTSQAAPQVAFTSLDGTRFTTNDLLGDVVLVKFWATSCTTCIQQMPDTAQTFQRFNKQGYQVIAVAMDYDKPSYVSNFARSRQLPFTVVHDEDGAIAQAFGDVQLTPTAFLIDKKGRIIKRYLGNYDHATFAATVEKALAG